ncbi:hypothetical protein ACMFMG_012234 [Clarireedia jacksonii]
MTLQPLITTSSPPFNLTKTSTPLLFLLSLIPSKSPIKNCTPPTPISLSFTIASAHHLIYSFHSFPRGLIPSCPILIHPANFPSSARKLRYVYLLVGSIPVAKSSRKLPPISCARMSSQEEDSEGRRNKILRLSREARIEAAIARLSDPMENAGMIVS